MAGEVYYQLGPRAVVTMNTTALSPARPCFVYYDRHIEKNAGSTMRVLMKRLEEHGECAYWGYFQGTRGWNAVMQALPQVNASVAPFRLCGALPTAHAAVAQHID